MFIISTSPIFITVFIIIPFIIAIIKPSYIYAFIAFILLILLIIVLFFSLIYSHKDTIIFIEIIYFILYYIFSPIFCIWISGDIIGVILRKYIFKNLINKN